MLTISTSEFVHPGNILLSPYVSISNHRYTHTLLDLVVEQHYIINIVTSQTVPHREARERGGGSKLLLCSYQFNGLHVSWFHSLWSSSAMNCDPCHSSTLGSLNQLHRLPAEKNEAFF